MIPDQVHAVVNVVAFQEGVDARNLWRAKLLRHKKARSRAWAILNADYSQTEIAGWFDVRQSTVSAALSRLDDDVVRSGDDGS